MGAVWTVFSYNSPPISVTVFTFFFSFTRPSASLIQLWNGCQGRLYSSKTNNYNSGSSTYRGGGWEPDQGGEFAGWSPVAERDEEVLGCCSQWVSTCPFHHLFQRWSQVFFFLNQWKIFCLPLVIRWVMREVKYWTNRIIFLLFLLPIAHQFYLTSHGGQLKKNMNENDKGWVNWKVVEQSSLVWFLSHAAGRPLVYLSKCRASDLCAITSVSRVTQGEAEREDDMSAH